MLPPLRELGPILASKVRHICSSHRPARTLEPFADLGRRTGAQLHLKESVKADVLNAIYPGLGHDWSELLFGTTTNLFYLMANYATQWEAIAACWAEGDYTLLQPAEPCWYAQLTVVVSIMMQTVTAKELELCAVPKALLPWPSSNLGISRVRVDSCVRFVCAGSASLAAPAWPPTHSLPAVARHWQRRPRWLPDTIMSAKTKGRVGDRAGRALGLQGRIIIASTPHTCVWV